MPLKGNRVCSCGRTVPAGECPCRRARKAEYDRNRPTAAQRGYGNPWYRESKEFLARRENRFCAFKCGRVADLVDHIIPHRSNPKLFWDHSNWQALCTHCHNTRKQSMERAL